jgi:pimeloyl-ACP methyl ester carboxylesterase
MVPTMTITGALDGCMPSELYDVAISPDRFASEVRVERLEGAGHFPHQERPDRINRLLIDWLALHG